MRAHVPADCHCRLCLGRLNSAFSRTTTILEPMAPADKRPSKDEDPVGWNEHREEELWLLYGDDVDHEDVENMRQGMRVVERLTSAEETLQIERQNGGIVLLQKDIRNFTLARMATDNFEREFKFLDTASRRQLVLEALCSTATIGDLETRGRWCPEITLANLADDGGRGFFEILETIMTADPTVDRTEVVHVLNPLMDRCWTLLDVTSKEIKERFQSHRDYFISMVIWRILLTFVSNATCYSYTNV